MDRWLSRKRVFQICWWQVWTPTWTLVKIFHVSGQKRPQCLSGSLCKLYWQGWRYSGLTPPSVWKSKPICLINASLSLPFWVQSTHLAIQETCTLPVWTMAFNQQSPFYSPVSNSTLLYSSTLFKSSFLSIHMLAERWRELFLAGSQVRPVTFSGCFSTSSTEVTVNLQKRLLSTDFVAS